jgi:hypothetical protein
VANRALPAIKPEELLSELLGLDPGLRRQAYYGERSIFYNPGGVAPLGTIVASIKDHDGPNDKAAKLSRQGVYRLAFRLPPIGSPSASASRRAVRPRAAWSTSPATTRPAWAS